MKISNKRSYTTIFLVLFISLPIFLIPLINNNDSNPFNFNIRDDSVNGDNNINPQAVNRTGKDFSNKTITSSNCYINREIPGLNEQPEIFLGDYILSYADMQFNDLEAINYTRNLEANPSDFIFNSRKGPKYVYQKFAIEVSQYINNVSIFIQDINDPEVFSDENSWEVAILNCSDDSAGTPNATLGEALQKPHPLVWSAHWEVFDFKNSSIGPIFLNISHTKKTTENGIDKYWFAFSVKIPPDYTEHNNYPKFLYFNPDGGEPENEGEGSTFAISPDFFFDNYTVNHVVENRTINGTWIKGDLDSFKDADDENRYIVTNDTNNFLNLTTRFELKDLRNSQYNYTELLLYIYFNYLGFRDTWMAEHYKYIYSIDFSIAINVNESDNIDNATLYAYRSRGLVNGERWCNISNLVDTVIDLENETESLKKYSIRGPWEKYEFLSLLDSTNSLLLKFEYNGTSDFNVSINQFTIEIGELDSLGTIQSHDPLIQEMYYAKSVSITNGTTEKFGNQSLELLKYNENDFYWAQADKNITSIEFKLHLLPDLDSSSWDIDYYDWISSYPNPLVPQIDIRVSSNVSINHPYNITMAALEIYKGDKTFEFFSEEDNEKDWIVVMNNRTIPYVNETTEVFALGAGEAWIVLNVLNESDGNSIRMRLRYETNSIFDEQFNVSIDEFSVKMYIQNAFSSDIASSIGLGLNSDTLKPSDIQLKNLGDEVLDDGSWEYNIADGTLEQGYYEFNVTSLWDSIRFNVKGYYEYYKLKVKIIFSEESNTQYMAGTNYFSVNITNWDGDPLENLEITFEVLDVNEKVASKATAITNELGIAATSLNFEELGSNFSVRVSFTESGIYAGSEVISEDFRVVNDFVLFLDTFLLILPYILIFIAGILVFMVLRQQKLSKYRKYWAGEALILDDLLKISYIMIIHKDAGVTIFNNQISMDLDSDLIGGFLTAISSFRSEIKKSGDDAIESGGKGFEMDYYDFKIVITDGSLVRVALILEGAPSENLKKNQWAFSNAFETKFKAILGKFTGNIEPFRETDKMVEKYFNITLTYPLKLGKHWEVIDLSPLEKALMEVAEQVQKEKKFFFVSSLLSFGLAGRKESRDQIVSTILSLKRKGLIIPIEMK